MNGDLKSAIVRVIGNTGQVVGAGLLVAERTVLTCAHVVAQALAIADTTADSPTQDVTLDFPLVEPGRIVRARLTQWIPVQRGASAQSAARVEDIALLTLQDPSPEGSLPGGLLHCADLWGHPFRAFGFPASHDDGVWAAGVLRDCQTNGLVQVEDTRAQGYFVAPGFSGTPVWDESVQAFVGIVVVAERRAEIRAAFIIPTSRIIEACPALRESLANERERTAAQTANVPAHAALRDTPDSASLWTDSDPQYGLFHRADRTLPGYRPDLLLVFLRAGNHTGAIWEATPAQALGAAGLDVDTLSIAYPDYEATPESVCAAAENLRAILSATFASYRHLIIVTLNGGLLVRRSLIDDARDAPRSAALVPFLNQSALTCRSRAIVSISTSQSSHDDADNPIVVAFEKHVHAYDMVGLPTPHVSQIPFNLSEDDGGFPRLAIHTIEGSAPRQRPTPPLAALIAERLKPFQSYTATAIARHTIARTCAMDAQVQRLFGRAESESNSTELATSDSQAAFLQRLIQWSKAPASQPLSVITGSAGVGKSVLLRVFSRRLASAWLQGGRDAALPLFFPMSQFNIDGSSPIPRDVWKNLSDAAAEWMTDLLASTASDDERDHAGLIKIDGAWIRNQLRRSATALVFDGVDEFILNHPTLSLTDFAALLQYLRAEFGENAQLAIIAGMRGSTRDLQLIAESESQVFTLRGMHADEASALFPSAMNLVGKASDPAVKELLLTPLILASLEKSELQLKPEAYLNRAALIDAALAAIVASLKRNWTGQPYSTTDWMNALSLIAWLLYRDLRGEIDDSHVAAAAERAVSQWSSEGNDTSEVVSGFRLLLEPHSRAALLRRSIFYSVRTNSYRLKHREWGDYLVSRYATLCIRHQQFGDLATRALNHDIYIMAGQQLQETDTDEFTVHALVERAATDGGFLILGNFGQMLGDSFAPLLGDVLDQEILSALHNFPAVIRFGILSALSSRLLNNDKQDSWSRHFRPVLIRSVLKHAEDDSENALVRSMCWCYLRAMTTISAPWPGLWDNDFASRDVLSMIATPSGGHYTVNAAQRSIQAAFMRIQFYALDIPSRMISTIHYLYPLVLAFSQGVSLDRTIIVEFPSLLADMRLDVLYRTSPIPEVRTIWDRCKTLYDETTAGATAMERAL